MRQRACVVVTMFCCFITSATPAGAECAWVLWRSDTEVTVSGKVKDGVFVPDEGRLFPQRWWEIETAVGKQTECAAAQRARMTRYLESTKKTGRYYEVFTSGDDSVTAIQWRKLGQIVVTLEEGDVVTKRVYEASFKCIPDTVNPRDSKGR